MADKDINIGDLRYRISIYAAAETVDGSGNVAVSPRVLRCVVWADIWSRSSASSNTNDEDLHDIVTRFTVRYNPAIQYSDLIEYAGRKFKPVGPPWQEDMHWTLIDTKEVVRHEP